MSQSTCPWHSFERRIALWTARKRAQRLEVKTLASATAVAGSRESERDRGRRVPSQPRLAVQGLPVSEPVLGMAVGSRRRRKEMNAMRHVIPRSGSRKVNGYMKAVLALEAVRKKCEERYTRVVRQLERKRDEVAEVARRLRALSSGQLAAAQR